MCPPQRTTTPLWRLFPFHSYTVASRCFIYWDSEVKSLQTTLSIRWSPMTPSDPCCNITCVVHFFYVCTIMVSLFLAFQNGIIWIKVTINQKSWTCVVLPTIIFFRSKLWTEYFHPSTQPWSSSGLHFCSSPAKHEVHPGQVTSPSQSWHG